MTNNEHNHPSRKQVINRFSRVIGHAESVKKMYIDGADCSDVLIQISAVKSALNNIGKIVLKDHINHCLVDITEENNKDALLKLNEAIDKYMK